LRKAVASKPFDAESGNPIQVTISAGIANVIGADDDLAKLLKRADVALYKAKHEGRNRVIRAAA
jgi:two-component system cell cycle response regulator